MDKSEQLKRAEKQVSLYDLYKKVFSGPDGEAVLMDMMKAHHCLGTTFDGDVNKMLVREGERNAVLRLLSILKTDVQKFRERIDEYAREME
jgi:hypothetical protein